jgi:DNA modification methylase
MSGLVNATAFRLPFADKSFHCAVSSPPYWGLRSYTDNPLQIFGGDPACKHKWSKPVTRKAKTGGVNEFSKDKFFYGGGEGSSFVPKTQSALCTKCGAWLGSYGLEPTLEQYVANTVLIMREVARVLRDDGVLWLNIGDCFATSTNGRSAADGKAAGKDDRTFRDKPFSTVGNGLKPKDMCGVPWRVALALQADGWWLRRDVIWSKPNPMPESISDRPATSHEYIFMLTKAARYFYDAEAVKEPSVTGDMRRPYGSEDAWQMDGRPVEQRHGGELRNRPPASATFKRNGSKREQVIPGQTVGTHRPDREDTWPNGTRNLRSVWTIPTQPFSGSHFATFPDTLAERCILASTSAAGVCAECGAPWERVTERGGLLAGDGAGRLQDYTGKLNSVSESQYRGANFRKDKFAPGHSYSVATRGWSPTCAHDSPTVPARVLDPFVGSGTTVAAARRLGRHGYGADLSLTYLRVNALPRAMRRSTLESMLTLPLFSNGEHTQLEPV